MDARLVNAGRVRANNFALKDSYLSTPSSPQKVCTSPSVNRQRLAKMHREKDKITTMAGQANAYTAEN